MSFKSVDHCKQSLVQLFQNINALNYTQAQTLLHLDKSLVGSSSEQLGSPSLDSRTEGFTFHSTLHHTITHLNPTTFTDLVQFTVTQLQSQAAIAEEDLIRTAGITKVILEEFQVLFRICLLQKLLTEHLNFEQLMLLQSSISQYNPNQQLVILQKLQQLFLQLHENTVAGLYEEIAYRGSNPFLEMLEFHQDLLVLYDPIVQLFSQQDLDGVLKFAREFPMVHPVQIWQLVQVFRFDPLTILELQTALCMEPLQKPNQDFPECSDGMDENSDDDSHGIGLVLSVLEQPNVQVVSKRNVRPHPVVVVNSSIDLFSQRCSGFWYMLEAKLYRADTDQPLDNLVGDVAQKLPLAMTPTLTFKKLKITTTSYQINQSMVYIRFELQKHSYSEAVQVLASTQTNPFLVVSHSNLIRRNLNSLAPANQLFDVIPNSASFLGGARVAVLGQGFLDSPNLRVWFGEIAVTPQFLSAGTLVCEVPAHPCDAYVDVRVGYLTQAGTQTVGGSSVKFHFDSLSPDPGKAPGQDYDDLHISFNALHISSACGDSRNLVQLLKRGAYVDQKDSAGNTGLFWAMFFKNLECAQLLLQHGANLNQLNSECKPLLGLVYQLPWVQQHKAHELALSLLKLGANPSLQFGLDQETALHYAAALGDVNMFRALVEYGACVNQLDGNGDSVLHWAVRENQVELVKLLLSDKCRALGVNVNLQNQDGETCLHIALECRHMEIVSELLQSGLCEAELRDAAGLTALEIAERGKLPVDLFQCLALKKPNLSNNLLHNCSFTVDSGNSGMAIPVIV